jgi:hypothetical protein
MVLANGRFAPGESGNPGGRKKEIEGLAKAIRAKLEKCLEDGTPVNEAVDVLMEQMRNAEHPKDIIAAVRVLLEYGYGKPTQAVEHEVKESLASLFDAMKARNIGNAD